MIEAGTTSVEEAAAELAGNWRAWRSFVWDRQREIDDPENWAVVYTHNRDSGLLDVSNAEVIAKELYSLTKGDDPDVVLERHSHWAVGHIDGYSIRVYRDNQITEAFKAYHRLRERLDDYPVLDEEDYSQREYDATLQNFADAACRLKYEYALPEGWEGEAYSWCSENRPGAVENADDQGGCPSEGDLRAAFDALGYTPVCGES